MRRGGAPGRMLPLLTLLTPVTQASPTQEAENSQPTLLESPFKASLLITLALIPILRCYLPVKLPFLWPPQYVCLNKLHWSPLLVMYFFVTGNPSSRLKSPSKCLSSAGSYAAAQLAVWAGPIQITMAEKPAN